MNFIRGSSSAPIRHLPNYPAPNQEETLRISERAVPVHLHAGSYSGQLRDQEVTDDTTDRYHAEKNACSVNKQIISRKFLSHVNSRINAARASLHLLE